MQFKPNWIAYLLFLMIITFSACSDKADQEIVSGQGSPFIVDPTTARSFILEFLNRKYYLAFPVEENWMEADLLSGDQGGSGAVQFTSGSLQVVMTYPKVSPENIVFSITVNDSGSGFSWNGILDSYGRVGEISFATVEPTLTSIHTLEPTVLPLTTNTPTPQPTHTPLLPGVPSPTPSPTEDLGPCNRAGFLGDVTIPDGTNFAGETNFIKTWRLHNTGSCTWTRDYDLVFIKGEQMGGPRELSLPHDVHPGESINISVDLVTPSKTGEYKGFWMLRSQDGDLFGLGFAGNQTFTVLINVLESKGDYVYDFAIYFCEAIWRSETGRLSCSNTSTEEFGAVRLLENPELENRREFQLALRVHPKEEQFGWITGTYPFVSILNGDRFKAWVGCLDGYGECNVTFYLNYQGEDGFIYHLGRWEEVYDGEITSIDIDLSALDGKSVRFILGMETNTADVEDAQGFWLAPRIEEPPGKDDGDPT